MVAHETTTIHKMTLTEQTQETFNPWGDFLQSCQEQHMQMMNAFMPHMPTAPIGEAILKATHALAEDPSRLLQARGELAGDMCSLWTKMLSLDADQTPPSPTDKRFRHQSWDTVPYFLFLKEYYLITSRWVEKNLSHMEGLDEESARKVRFYIKQMLDAACPANTPFTNPEVLEEFVKTKGQSLKNGLETLFHDMEEGKWMRMTDPSAFQLGATLATTKGEVVYRNHLFELIHYAPLTSQQYATPLLIIPPWINKYYIFDLSPSNSFVKWMLEQGHNVFMISWVNPGPTLGSMTFEDYLIDGAYEACEVVSNLTKQPALNTMGYCVGGNLLTALNAYLAKRPASFTIQTMTLLATVVDFEKMGDLRVFVDEEHLQQVEHMMAQTGVLDGESLKSLFSLLRPNDLVWSFFIKNYFLGQVPPAFDFLYWNSDSTRLPEGLHGFVLRKFFQENLFMKPSGITIKGVPIDVQEIMTPAFLLSTVEDHISPWQSTYPAVHLFKGPVEFVLAGSGHVAGVMNHPIKNKYGYWTYSAFPDEAQDWLDMATPNEGSWWPAWDAWVASFGDDKIPSLTTYPHLGSAPGSYVMVK